MGRRGRSGVAQASQEDADGDEREAEEDRDKGNIVNRAIRLLGADTSAQEFATRLQETSKIRVTRQMVNGWQTTGQFPIEFVAYVHLLTRIPVKELVEARGRRAKSKTGGV